MTRTASVIAANRFGLGARPGELAAISDDPRAALREQVSAPQPPPREIADLPDGAGIFQEFLRLREEISNTRREKPNVVAGSARQAILPHYLAQAAARVRVAINTPVSFHERLVQFWSNHFAVSVDKAICTGLAGALENEAIRPHVSARFIDLLLAVESHPAMIAYLDNQYSVGPKSDFARPAWWRRRHAQRTGINENLAREALELHTLGVNGGYTQTDVTMFAEVLSGWSIGGERGVLEGGTPGTFYFHDTLHEPGDKTVLGKTYREDGVEQARSVFRDLARHPATGRLLATKLVKHFVSDEPPADCVERLSRAYYDSDGHLPTVYSALIDCASAWNTKPAKFKTPQDYVYSVYRALDLAPKESTDLLAPFTALGQAPWSPGSPAGWPDTAADWDGADALMKRIEWTVALGERVGNASPPQIVAAQTLGPLANERTLDGIRRASSGSQGLALLLLSPEFLRR